MTCDFPEDVLIAFHDDALPPDERAAAEAHVVACIPCRETLGVFGGMDAALRTPLDRPPASLGAALALVVRRRRRARRIFAAAIAAAFLLAAWTGYRAAATDPSDAFRPEDRRPVAATVVGREAALVDAIELDASALRLELSIAEGDAARRLDLEGRVDAVLHRVDDVRRDLARNP